MSETERVKATHGVHWHGTWATRETSTECHPQPEIQYHHLYTQGRRNTVVMSSVTTSQLIICSWKALRHQLWTHDKKRGFVVSSFLLLCVCCWCAFRACLRSSTSSVNFYSIMFRMFVCMSSSISSWISTVSSGCHVCSICLSNSSWISAVYCNIQKCFVSRLCLSSSVSS